MTLRQLSTMAHGRDWQQWWHTASIAATIANCHRDPKRRPRPFSAREFHPYESDGHGGAMPVAGNIDVVIGMFVSPERAKAAEAKAISDKAEAERLAAEQRKRLTHGIRK